MMRRTLPLLCLLLLAAGCRTPSPDVVLHTLRPLAPEAAPAAGDKPLLVEVMPVQMPEMLQRSQLVLLDGQDRHRLSATHRWGNPLEKDMQRVLADNLSARLGGGAAVLYPLGEAAKVPHRVSLDVQQCDGAPGGSLRFRATWTVTHPGEGRVLLLRRSSLEEPVGGGRIEDLVAAHNRVLDRLSQEIALALKGLGSPEK